MVPGRSCDLGMTKDGQEVSDLLVAAMGSTLRLVVAATVLAIVLGVLVGIVSALRQYSGFDYTITFSAFLFFSLPLFWVAVLLKQYVAIAFNNWLADPVIAIPDARGPLAAVRPHLACVLGGNRRRKWIIFGVAFVATALILFRSRRPDGSPSPRSARCCSPCSRRQRRGWSPSSPRASPAATSSTRPWAPPSSAW